MLNILKYYITPLFLAIIQFTITVLSKFDNVFFDYSVVNYKFLFIVRVFYFLFLFFGWSFIFFVYRKIKEGNKLFIRGAKIAAINFFIMMVLLVLVWPGLWAWDDIWVLYHVSNFQYLFWQHFLTNTEMAISAQTLPFFGGILILRIAWISAFIGFIIVKLETTFNLYLKNTFFDLFIKLFPFFTFPVIRYELSGYRSGFSLFFEIAMICILLSAFKGENKWSNLYCAIAALISAVAITWRLESIIYLPFVILVILTAKSIGTVLKRSLTALFLLFAVITISGLQNYYSGKITGSDYELLSTLPQCINLIQKADKNKYNTEINNLAKVLKLEILYDNPDKSGSDLFWFYGIVREGYTQQDYKKYLKSFFRLSLVYPLEFIKERTEVLIETNGFRGSNKVYGTTQIKTLLSQNADINMMSPIFEDFGDKTVLNKPINRKLHNKITSVIILDKNEFLYKIVWNFLYPSFLIFMFWCILLFKKQYKAFLLFSSIFIKFIIVFLTAPQAQFMYYLPFYLLGYIILFYLLLYLFSKKNREITNKNITYNK